MSNEVVKVNLTHSILSIRMPEIRLSLMSTIESVKIICQNKFGKLLLSKEHRMKQ